MATVLTNAGRAILTNRITGAGTQPTYIGWGTGAGTAAVGDTTLFTEASEARTNGTPTRTTTTATNDTWQLVGEITADGSKTITNAGCFDASAAGNLFIKFDFTGVALLATEKINFTIKATF